MRMADTFSPRRQLHILQGNEIAQTSQSNVLNFAPKSMLLNFKLGRKKCRSDAEWKIIRKRKTIK